MARPKKKIKTPEETVQEIIGGIVVDSEYRTAASMQNADNENFESLIDMLECRRAEKDYEWLSDYYIPEMNSIMHTEAAMWSGTMFSTRDFVEVKLDGEQPTDFSKAKAAKKVINKTLNDRDLFYYPKYMRLRMINALKGNCYAVGWWEQERRTETQTIEKLKLIDVDVNGNPTQDPAQRHSQIPVTIPVEQSRERPVVDRFNFDVADPRNVFTDNKYCYSIQQKDWITIRSEAIYDELKANEKKNNYFNLDKVKEAVKNQSQTDTAKETYAKEADGEINKTPKKYFDILDRYGKFWAIVIEKDKKGTPVTATPGIDTDGMPKDDAELIEMIITFVIVGNTKIMIRFEPTPFIDATGKPYKPIARGLCYVHPVKDEGISDGQNMKELQIGINDTFNMSSDRVKLATLPTFKGRKGSMDDNNSFYIEPEHVIEVENMDDLQELKISDNIQGSLEQQGMLTSKLQQVTAVFPTTMGGMPDSASTTATAVAGAETRTNARANYKSLTFEYTFLQEFYWMILQMTHRFAMDETLVKMLGEDVKFFDANSDYTYSPVTSAIEQEHSKYKKIQLYDQAIGRISGMVQQLPKVIPIIAFMLAKQLELQDNELSQIGKMLEDLASSNPNPEGGEPKQTASLPDQPMSNQNNTPMSGMEQSARQDMMPQGVMGGT